MNGVVLDASAVLAVLRGERGAEVVAGHLSRSVIATVNLGEIVTVLSSDGISPDTIRAMLAGLTLEMFAFDADLAVEAGLMFPLTRSAGLSLGDRACLALARRRGDKVFTADRAWARVADAVGVEVELIR